MILIFPLISLFLITWTNLQLICKEYIYYQLLTLNILYHYDKQPLKKQLAIYFFICSGITFIILLTINYQDTHNITYYIIIIQFILLCYIYYNSFARAQNSLVTLNNYIDINVDIASTYIKEYQIISEKELRNVCIHY